MFFFFHLLVGVVTGLLLSEILRSRRWLLPLAVGSVLPDLIDKPLGHILFAETIGNGRIIGHSLVFLATILMIAVLLWKYRGSLLFFGLGIGVLIHQVLDSMWEIQATWYYPLFGPFPTKDLPNFFINSFWRSLASPQEWLALLLLAGIGLIFLLKWSASRCALFQDLSNTQQKSSSISQEGSHPPSGSIPKTIIMFFICTLSGLLTQMMYPCMTAAGLVLVGLGISVYANLSHIESTWLSLLVKGGDPFIMALALFWCGAIFLWIPYRRLLAV